MKAQLISISEAARLVGKARETVMKAAQGLKAKPGPKNAKLYDANALMMSIDCGNSARFGGRLMTHFGAESLRSIRFCRRPKNWRTKSKLRNNAVIHIGKSPSAQ